MSTYWVLSRDLFQPGAASPTPAAGTEPFAEQDLAERLGHVASRFCAISPSEHAIITILAGFSMIYADKGHATSLSAVAYLP